MTIRRGLGIFVVVFALTLLSVRAGSHFVVERSMRSDRQLLALRQAESAGESDFAMRLRIKGVYYSEDPKIFMEPPSGTPAVDQYLKGLFELRTGRYDEAERLFGLAAESDSPLVAARAKIRFDEMRYRTGFPNAERLPF